MLHLLVALLISTGVSPDALPESVRPLAAVWENQDALVEALRARDKEVTQRVEELMHPLPVDGSSPPRVERVPNALEQAKKIVDEVRQAYEAAIATYPANARLHNYYGEWLYDHYGEIPAALKAWHRAIDLDHKMSSAYNNLALHNFEYGEYRVGLHQMDLAIKYDKDNPDYLYNLSNVYLVHFPQIGQIRKWDKKRVFKEAMKLSKRAAKLAPDDYQVVQDVAVNYYAGENMGLQVDWAEAARAWQAARALADREDQRFYCWLNEARVWLRAKQPSSAEACLNEALRLRPDNEVARNLLNSISTGQPVPDDAGLDGGAGATAE
jgi:tetratricopeptide (TPR) repeat protein